MKNNGEFNMVIVGTGGQGVLTLLRILSEAVLLERKDVKTSELHGLAQRGGSVEVHIRSGNKIFSPLVSQAQADLILALEFQEALRALYYSSSQTKFLINKHSIPIPGKSIILESKILDEIKKFTRNIEIIKAADICKKEFGKEILAGVYLISFASNKNLIPIKPDSIFEALKKIIPEKYLELNLKAFDLAKK
ncbi:hypothetical protein AMJ49_00775 [Parcubacteria bacterium DG_74_2]|nr:MAG: hypothetical protein AMJ49_00775 [Parcubacteria bacterium DG_74_2]